MLEELKDNISVSLFSREFYSDVLSGIRGGENAYLLTGRPGLGKTSALKHFRSQARGENMQVASLPLKNMATTPESLVKSIVEEFQQILKTGITGTETSVNPGTVISDMFTQASKRYRSTGEKLLMLVDDLEEIIPLSNFPSARNFPMEFLDICSSGADGLIFISASSFPALIEKHLKTKKLPEMFNVVDVSFSDEESVRFAEFISSTGGEIEIDNALFERCGRNPEVFRIVTEFTEANAGQFPDIAEILADVFHPLRIYYSNMYNYLLSKSQGYGLVKELMKIIASREGMTLTEIARLIDRDKGPARSYLLWLIEVGIIHSEEKKYYFSDPVLRDYVLKLHAQPETESHDVSKPHKSITRPASSRDESDIKHPKQTSSNDLMEID